MARETLGDEVDVLTGVTGVHGNEVRVFIGETLRDEVDVLAGGIHGDEVHVLAGGTLRERNLTFLTVYAILWNEFHVS